MKDQRGWKQKLIAVIVFLFKLLQFVCCHLFLFEVITVPLFWSSVTDISGCRTGLCVLVLGLLVYFSLLERLSSHIDSPRSSLAFCGSIVLFASPALSHLHLYIFFLKRQVSHWDEEVRNKIHAAFSYRTQALYTNTKHWKWMKRVMSPEH